MMARIVRTMLADILEAVIANDKDAASDISQRENQVDMLQRATAAYLTQINRGNLSLEESERSVQLLYVSNELEHIGDVVETNLVALLLKKVGGNLVFSWEGSREVLEFHRRVLASYDQAIRAFLENDAPTARSVASTKPKLVSLEHSYRRTHYARLADAKAESIASSEIHLDLIDYLRRINSYSESIANTVLSRQAERPRDEPGESSKAKSER